MDAGLAGLIGALGGGIVGAAGASVAAVITFRGARYQADKQRQAAHEQWLRQIRRDAYSAFLIPAKTAVSLICRVDPPSSQEDLAELEAAITGMRNAMGPLTLEAPERIVNGAEALSVRTRSRHLHLAHRRTIPQRHRNRQDREITGIYRALVDSCRKSLQETDEHASMSERG